MLWDNTFGKIGRDFLFAADITSDGGVILEGYVQPFSGGECDFASSEDGMSVAKVDVAGQFEWSKGYGPASYGQDFLHDIKQTPDGGFILGGSNKEDMGG